jgi:uncharacterized protein (TIGR00369 family)
LLSNVNSREISAIEANTVESRFGIDILAADVGAGAATLSMSLDAFVGPLTGLPSLGALAVLLDGAGGLSNHWMRPEGAWTITSELSLDLHRSAMSGGAVVARSKLIAADAAHALSFTSLSVNDVEIGSGMLRSLFVREGPQEPDRPCDPIGLLPELTLLDRLSLRQESAGQDYRLVPQPDPILNNGMGMVHGGVVGATLELVAAGALHLSVPPSEPKYTGGLRINYLRPMNVGGDARYEAAVARVGRNIAIVDSSAIRADGREAARARVTSYA